MCLRDFSIEPGQEPGRFRFNHRLFNCCEFCAMRPVLQPIFRNEAAEVFGDRAKDSADISRRIPRPTDRRSGPLRLLSKAGYFRFGCV